MVLNAKKEFNLKSCECREIDDKFDVIIVHNAFFYIHPRLQKKYLRSLTTLLNKSGRLYITVTPDLDKRCYVKNRFFICLIWKFLPVYQSNLAGFFINDKGLKLNATQVGLRYIEKKDSWSLYRSHWIFQKE